MSFLIGIFSQLFSTLEIFGVGQTGRAIAVRDSPRIHNSKSRWGARLRGHLPRGRALPRDDEPLAAADRERAEGRVRAELPRGQNPRGQDR